MLQKLKENKTTVIISAIGVTLISIISFIIITSNQTIKAWVPNKKLETGHTITEQDLKQIDIPAKTPGSFIKNKDMVVGYKLKNNVEPEQLLYSTDFLASWESYSQDTDIPEDYVITSIQVPDSRAVGGLIAPGDTIDIMGVSTTGKRIGFDEANLTGINGRDNIGTNVYYILSNVKVINTNSSIAKAQDNDLSEVVDENSNSGDGNYYIVALSYDDAKKLRQAEGVLDLWLNLSPRQNDENPPLINQMAGQSFSGLHDAQKPVQDKNGKPINGANSVAPQAGEVQPQTENSEGNNEENKQENKEEQPQQ